jgi:hypothetical protein
VASYLPEEVIEPVRPRHIISTWVWVIVLVLVANFVLAPRLLEGGRNLAGWIIGHKWRLLLGLHEPVDDLILGDSSCNQGVNPVELARGLGDDRAVNLCTIGDMLALNDAWMLQAYLERHGPPKRVIIVHVYDIWGRDFEAARMGSIPVGFTTLRRLEPPVRLSRWQLRSYLESRYFPLYSSNLSLRGRLRPGDPSLGDEAGPRRVDSLGFLAATVAFPDSVSLDLAGHLRFLQDQAFKLSADNARSLRRIGELAERHGFPVYLATAPIYDSLAGSISFLRYYAPVNQALTSAAASSRVHTVFEQPMTFPAGELQNADHLVLAAANRYSRALAERIREIETKPTSY